MHGESERETELREIIGESPVFKSVLRQAIEAAKNDSIVLLTGEAGTGKELMARAIHRMGSRRTQSFVKIDCSDVPPAQLEAALFGPDKSRLKAANRGTLLLSHVANVSPELYPRLLRALEQKQFEHSRGETAVPIDVRLIATSSDNGQRIEDSWLRKGLSPEFKLSVINIPALRERPGDIPLLAQHFVRKWARLMKKTIDAISPEAMNSLIEYRWPGNIRELEMVIERAVSSSKNADLHPELPSSAG
jgi:formate hydrogenlyase transcriptional activator